MYNNISKTCIDLFWELMLLASGVKLTENWWVEGACVVGYIFIAVATVLITKSIIPVLKTKESD